MLRNKKIKGDVSKLLTVLLLSLFLACSKSEEPAFSGQEREMRALIELPNRCDDHPETTNGVPHQQIDVDLVPLIDQEMKRRIYSLPGVEEKPSVVSGWQGIWLKEEMPIAVPDAIIGGREFAHIHTDGSLHLFLEPSRAFEVQSACWGVLHPFAVQMLDGWDGFTMLYTPQNEEELNVTFQVIVDAYNFVTDQEVFAGDFYDRPKLDLNK